MPFIIFLSYWLGGLVMGVKMSNLHYTQGPGLQWIKENLVQYLLGSITFGLLLAAVMGPLTYLLLSVFRKEKP